MQDLAAKTLAIRDSLLGNEQGMKKAIEDVKEIAALDYNGLDADELADEEAALKKSEKELRDHIGALENMKNSSRELFRTMAQATEEFKVLDAQRDALKVQYDEIGKDYKVKQDAILADIKKLKESMSDSDVALYEQMKESCGKSKAFVALSGQTCQGCGIDLEPSVFQTVTEKGYGICPNCHKMVYLKNEN